MKKQKNLLKVNLIINSNLFPKSKSDYIMNQKRDTYKYNFEEIHEKSTVIYTYVSACTLSMCTMLVILLYGLQIAEFTYTNINLQKHAHTQVHNYYLKIAQTKPHKINPREPH